MEKILAIQIICANVECSQVEKSLIPIANNPEQDYVPSSLSRELGSIELPWESRTQNR